uniref:Uncharacterized protein n=1 Tax=Arundo donax TaxID=35708 RepID=A0A0A9G4E6_ARUDO
MSGLASVIADRSVDFPAFGSPTRPTSATTLKINSKLTSSPG